MKNTFFLSVLLVLSSLSVSAQFRVRDDAFIQIGYADYRTLSFGTESNSPNNGRFALEYWNKGLNFWKPWPTSNSSNFNLFLRDDGNMGVGTSGDPSWRLDVSGAIRCWSLEQLSDKRLKTNIKPLGSSLDKILKLNGVSYAYNFQFDKYGGLLPKDLTESKQKTMENDKNVPSPTNIRMGLIAQEVETVIPEVVGKDSKGYLSVNYVELIPLLIEAMKEQNSRIQDLEKKLSASDVKLNAPSKVNDAKSQTGLQNNFPNPFGDNTVIRYNIADDESLNDVSIGIYDPKGVLIGTYPVEKKFGNGQVELKMNRNLILLNADLFLKNADLW